MVISSNLCMLWIRKWKFREALCSVIICEVTAMFFGLVSLFKLICFALVTSALDGNSFLVNVVIGNYLL